MLRACDVRIRPLQAGDVEALVADLRFADLQEVLASTTGRVDNAVLDSVQASSEVYTAECDLGLLAVFGVAPLSMLPPVGAPWLLGTSLLERNSRVLVRLSPMYIQRMLGSFQQLLNYVDARNEKSVRWLRRVGFTIREPEPYGPYGLPFHRFDMGFD